MQINNFYTQESASWVTNEWGCKVNQNGDIVNGAQHTIWMIKANTKYIIIRM